MFHFTIVLNHSDVVNNPSVVSDKYYIPSEWRSFNNFKAKYAHKYYMLSVV